MMRPAGGAGRCCASTRLGCAGATAASKMLRSRGVRSVIRESTALFTTTILRRKLHIHDTCPKRKHPRKSLAGMSFHGPKAESRSSVRDLGAQDGTEAFPALALEPHQLQLLERREIGRAG